MRHSRLQDMTKGWFIGLFSPAAYTCNACEVAVKHYREAESEGAHYHKVATEITVVISGVVKMCGQHWTAGSIVVLDPGDVTDFTAIVDSTTVVVKIPGALNDKYMIEKHE